jgi:hypothetical protein
VGPGVAALEGEIVGIGKPSSRWLLGFEQLISNAVALAISDRLLFGRKTQVHLLAHVAGRSPPISGSIARGSFGSKSSTQSLVLAKPDCMAVLAGI